MGGDPFLNWSKIKIWLGSFDKDIQLSKLIYKLYIENKKDKHIL
jgi:hypothetical protein